MWRTTSWSTEGIFIAKVKKSMKWQKQKSQKPLTVSCVRCFILIKHRWLQYFIQCSTWFMYYLSWAKSGVHDLVKPYIHLVLSFSSFMMNGPHQREVRGHFFKLLQFPLKLFIWKEGKTIALHSGHLSNMTAALVLFTYPCRVRGHSASCFSSLEAINLKRGENNNSRFIVVTYLTWPLL